MKKSALLNYIYVKLEAWKAEDGVAKLTAGYFLAAALDTLAEPKLPRAVTATEVKLADRVLDKHKVERDGLAARLRAAVRDRADVGAVFDDEASYTLMVENVSFSVGKDGAHVLPDYLEEILGTPSDLIRAVMGGKAAPAATPKKSDGSIFDAVGGISISDLFGGKRPAAPKAEAIEPEEVKVERIEPEKVTAEVATPKKPKRSKKSEKEPPAEADEAPAEVSAEAESDADVKKKVEDETINRILASIGGPSSAAGDDSEVAVLPEEKLPEGGLARLAYTVNRTAKIQKALLSRVVGQDHAVRAFVSGYFQSRLVEETGQKKKRSEAIFLFAGPPGVGKTFLAENAAEILGLPFKRFDMSEYSEHNAPTEFCGSDKVYTSGKEGNVTGFVAKHPKCVLLFDEIEKAHISIIYLFLQVLDAGRLRDNYTDKVVSFADTVMIFTTNVGRQLYEDPTIENLGALPRKKILQALEAERDPANGTPLFPSAICSRFAAGNVLMFNRLGADHLHYISSREIAKHADAFSKTTDIKVTVDPRVPSALIFSEGGRADARTVRGRSAALFHEELYELFRLMSEDDKGAIEKLTDLEYSVKLDGDDEVASLFVNPNEDEILIFAEGATAKAATRKLAGFKTVVISDLDEAKKALFSHDFSLILCDVRTGVRSGDGEVLNAEDIVSAGQDLISHLHERGGAPVYLLAQKEGDVGREEFLSFAQRGVRDLLTVSDKGFADKVKEKCVAAYQQENILKLAKHNKILSYKTAQSVSPDGKHAKVTLFNFRLALSADAADSGSIMDTVSRPSVRFADVIGAEDAKAELGYFAEYLKNPVKFMREGLRAPKGVLLYGPPGTGKTLLAKALAGESDVTFMAAEGNRFLKRFVGEGPAAVHDFFRTARKYAPTIVFIDEIDAIGKDRMSSESAEHTGDVLTALLTEMDGFNVDATKPVFVLAATNYSVDPASGRALDGALLRRFDRRIYVDLPTKDERRRFLEMKLQKTPAVTLSKEQIDNVAIRSTGMSLAELDSVFEMALRGAYRTEGGKVGDSAFEEAFETFTNGEARKKHDPDALLATARHEAGHALLCWLYSECPSYLTIVSRGDHGGYMQHADTEEKGSYKKTELLARIRTALAGRAAEMVYYGDDLGLTTGASGDLQTATRLAEAIIGHYGMDEAMGLSSFDRVPDGFYPALRARTNAILAEELSFAKDIICTYRSAIDALVDALLDKNHLKGDEIDAILKKATKKK